MEANEINLRDYFLGTLADDQVRSIDLRIIEDADFSNELSAAEEDLIEDYLESRLNGQELSLFNSNYRISSSREQLIKEISALRHGAALLRLADTDQPAKRGAMSSGFLRAIFAFGLLGLAVAAGLLWFTMQAERLTPLESEYATINRSSEGGPTPVDSNSVFNLIPVTARAANDVPTKRAEAVGKHFVFRLALPLSGVKERKYDVRIYRDSQLVFTQPQLPGVQNAAGEEIRLLVPKEVLVPGNHRITVEYAENDAVIAAYNFRIE